MKNCIKNSFRHIKRFIKLHLLGISPSKCGHLDDSASIGWKVQVYNTKNLYLYEKTNVDENAVIMNTRAKFIMKKWSGAAIGLTVVTGEHMSIPGLNLKEVTDEVKDKYDAAHKLDRDVIVEEDVWIGANVMLLKGVTIGRGSIIGAGAVVRKNTPPYAIVIGNPAKIVGFRFTPEEALEHEKKLYAEDERLSYTALEKHYEKYFFNRMQDIAQFVKI